MSVHRSTPGTCPGRHCGGPTRRQMLAASAGGFGLLAFSGMLSQGALTRQVSAALPHQTPRPHFVGCAKSVIFCFMDGGVSHVDSFDPKPKLAELDGQPYTASRNPTANGNRQWLKSPWEFKQ